MSITSITIENFKGIKDKVKIDFKPITLLFGPNSAGKSTIIQALHYLREIFVNQNPDADVSFAYDGTVRLGGFKNFVHGHNLNNKIIIGIELANENKKFDPGSVRYAIEQEKLIKHNHNLYVEIAVSWCNRKSEPVVESFCVFIEYDKLIELSYNKSNGKTFLLFFNQEHAIFDAKIQNDPELKFIFNKKEEVSTWRQLFEDIFGIYFANRLCEYDHLVISSAVNHAFPVKHQGTGMLEISREGEDISGLGLFDRFIYEKIVLKSIDIVNQSLLNFLRIGPVREIPDRIEANQVPSQQRFITGKAAWDILYSADEAFIEKFNYWISSEEKLSTGYSAYQKNIVEIDNKQLPEDITIEYISSLPSTKKLIFKDSNDVEVMPQDVGFGFSQILPVVVAALMGENETTHLYHGSKEHKKIISIEQPELHIHPKLQVELGDLFIEQSINKNVIFLIETHSEHLILRILRRIRETSEGELEEGATPITPDQVSVLYVQPDKKGSQVMHIPVNEEGEFDRPWPQGFFAERAKELF